MELDRTRLRRSNRERKRGTTMVEAVFTIPVLLTVFFAIAEFGVAFGQWQTLNNAAREGARLAIVYRKDCDTTAVELAVTDKVEAYVTPLGLAGDVTVTPTNVCGGSGTNATVRVEATYNYLVLDGFVDSLNDLDLGIELVGESVMRNEG